LHLLPHWTWPGREGEVTPVHCYTSYDAAELFVNGRSQGIQKKDTSKYGRYRLHWDSVRYEPGEIKIIAWNRTAGDPYKIKLIVDKAFVKAGGKDLCFVTVQVLDKAGNLCPVAKNNIRFELTGKGVIRGVANGDPANIQSLSGNEMQAFNGQCLVIIAGGDQQGLIKIKAGSGSLLAGEISISAVK
jgi:beta-galactosidase